MDYIMNNYDIIVFGVVVFVVLLIGMHGYKYLKSKGVTNEQINEVADYIVISKQIISVLSIDDKVKSIAEKILDIAHITTDYINTVTDANDDEKHAVMMSVIEKFLDEAGVKIDDNMKSLIYTSVKSALEASKSKE